MIYATLEITIENQEAFKAYGEHAVAALKKHSAEVVAVSDAPERIEGSTAAPTRSVIVSFPSKEAAMGWINDPDLQDAHALRRASGKSEILLLG